MGHVLAFAAVAVVMIVTPGPDTALIVRNTLFGGRGNGVRTSLGVVTGIAIWNAAAAAGIAAIVAASYPLFLAIRVGGAVYLVWLGIRALRAAVRGYEAPPATEGGRRNGYRQGLLSNLGNPKVAVVFTSLLPQFASSLGGLLALGLLFWTMATIWLTGYALVVARAQILLMRGPVRRILDAVMGLALVAFGARLATEKR
ncbi:MAG: LysE family translocator [Gaiellaceae bacterium]